MQSNFHQDGLFLPVSFPSSHVGRKSAYKNKTCLYVLVSLLVRNSLCHQCEIRQGKIILASLYRDKQESSISC